MRAMRLQRAQGGFEIDGPQIAQKAPYIHQIKSNTSWERDAKMILLRSQDGLKMIPNMVSKRPQDAPKMQQRKTHVFFLSVWLGGQDGSAEAPGLLKDVSKM